MDKPRFRAAFGDGAGRIRLGHDRAERGTLHMGGRAAGLVRLLQHHGSDDERQHHGRGAAAGGSLAITFRFAAAAFALAACVWLSACSKISTEVIQNGGPVGRTIPGTLRYADISEP